MFGHISFSVPLLVEKIKRQS